MIYMSELFNNYEEFKELFGMQEHGNGTKSRRNKILLQMVKSRAILHLMASANEYHSIERVWDWKHECYSGRLKLHFTRDLPYGLDFYCIRTMDQLKRYVLRMLDSGRGLYLAINGLYDVRSSLYRSDDFNGICEDGDIRSIRYVNVERDRVFKMRAGKFLRKIIEEHADVDALLPEQVKIWVCEDFAESWKAYASNAIGRNDYTLCVNDRFDRIYDGDECKGNFGSCMVNDGYWTFYRDSVDASAAYLEDRDGMIVARCVIYNDVTDGNGKKLRLAERQYATDGDESLKRMLVMRLIEGGHIDGYKRVGADCHSPKAFLDCQGNPLEDYHLSIPCNLEDYDTVSYQDSFKWYDEDELVARNYGDSSEGNLSVTGGEREEDHSHQCWSNYNDEWIDEDDAYYVDTRDDHFYYHQTVLAQVRHSSGRYYKVRCFEGDCVEVGSDYYYAGDCADYPNEYGICLCPRCGDYFISGDGYYSDLTEEEYCCCSCMESAETEWHEDNGEVWSDFDGKWFDEDDVIRVWQWRTWAQSYCRTTVSIDSFNELVEEGEATEYLGDYYIDSLNFEGEPAHYFRREKAA